MIGAQFVYFRFAHVEFFLVKHFISFQTDLPLINREHLIGVNIDSHVAAERVVHIVSQQFDTIDSQSYRLGKLDLKR